MASKHQKMKFRHKLRYWGMRALMPLGLADFEPAFYLQMNPDVAASGADPLSHWVIRGRKEVRLCSSKQMKPAKDAWLLGGATMCPDKQTILLVSHEASRTGAPILCLSLARRLKDQFNVLVLLLKDGPLTPHFKDASSRIAVAGGRGANDLRSLMWGLDSIGCQVDAAIVNSIVSYPVLAYTRHIGIPTLMLVHEYAAYCKPADPFHHVVNFSDRVVFSAETTKKNAIDEIGDLPVLKRALVLPQGRCIAEDDVTKESDLSAERARIDQVLPVVDRQRVTTVIGAGSVNIRKGVDVFIQCAAAMQRKSPSASFRFVWVGGGFEPDKDLGYSVYLHEQVRRSGLVNSFTFLDEVADIQRVYDRADILLLTSRLDPLPNVSIDAVCNGIPLLCFDQASGMADILINEGLSSPCVAPYLDVEVITDKALALIADEELKALVRNQFLDMANRVFSMDKYATGLADEVRALIVDRASPA